jgi:hypothetical protein
MLNFSNLRQGRDRLLCTSCAMWLALSLSACATPPDQRSPSPRFTHSGPTSFGWSRFNEQPWTQLSGDGWQYLRRASSKDDSIEKDDTAPVSPPYVVRIVFTPDMARDSEPSVHWIGLPNVREVYTAWWIKLSANWTSSPAGAGKMTFLHVAPSGAGQVYMGLFGSQPPHRVSMNTEWMPYGQKVWDPNRTTTPILYDRWYRVEWQMNWDGPGDGTVRWWVDESLNGEYTNVLFPADGSGFQQFELAPTLQNPPAREQYIYIDHTYVAVR